MSGYFIALAILGVGFKLLIWWMSPFKFHIVFLIEGAISGLGVATGIFLADKLKSRVSNPNKWYIRALPYTCGGVAVFLGKGCIKFFCPSCKLELKK